MNFSMMFLFLRFLIFELCYDDDWVFNIRTRNERNIFILSYFFSANIAKHIGMDV